VQNVGACQSDTCVIFIESITGINPHVARYLLFRNVMKLPFKYILSIAVLTAALTLPARATFEELPVGTDAGGVKLWNDVAHHNVTDFETFVGANNSGGHSIHVHTFGPVDSGSGFATIKPVNGGSLTDLIFTPDDPKAFSDFSFRGQLTAFGDGTVTLIVTDSGGNVQTFTFSGLGQNDDFARRGIISTDGETIKSVELQSDFKEVKQIEVSFGTGVVPDGGATVMLLGAALSVLGLARRYLKS